MNVLCFYNFSRRNRKHFLMLFKLFGWSLQRTNHVKFLHSDQGTEFCSAQFNNFLEKKGTVEKWVWFTHHNKMDMLNALIKSLLSQNVLYYSLLEQDRSFYLSIYLLLTISDVLKLWAKVMNIAVYLLNQTINKQVGINTPYDLWHNMKRAISHYRVFGTIAYIFLNEQFMLSIRDALHG